LPPAVGDIVRVRSRQYLVEEVVPPPQVGDSTLVGLSCLEDDALGDRLEVLWEREPDARPVTSNWAALAGRGFDEPRLFSAYLHTLRWNCVTATNPKLFQSPYRAGIEVKAYQLEPLRKALLMPRVNLFIADDVGLGKTIEAGLILRELLMRQKVRRTVICAPPSVVRQWRDEMDQRFGLHFVVYDREFVTAVRRERGYSVNPFTTHNRFIISHALIRNEDHLAPLRDWLGEFSGGSMLILDEAHNVAPASSSRYAIDSKLTRTVRDLAPRFEHRLFLSATPHNGHSNSFAALLEILDPQRFCRGVSVKGAAGRKLLETVMVRRLKKDLRSLDEDFPDRKVIRVEIRGLADDAPEIALSRMLQRYRDLREARLGDAPRSRRNASMLVLTSLQKRLLSSVEAFARTLAVHRRAMDQATLRAEGREDFSLLEGAPGQDDDRAELPEEEVEAETDLEVERATRFGTAPSPEELKLLDEMSQVAARGRCEPDSRVRWLVDWIRVNLCPDLGQPGARWLNRRVLVFTDYSDTRRYLEQQLGRALAGSDLASDRVGRFHGGMAEEAREAIKAAFNMDPERHPLRILVATDAAREGVNLQNHCADLIHFDVPWNPSKMEQRNGRIDRKLQREHEVRCHYFVLPQRAEDRVLDVLVQKTGTIHDELGSLPAVVERRVSRLLKDGIRTQDEGDLTRALQGVDQEEAGAEVGLNVVREELEETRQRQEDLAAQLRALEEQLRLSQEWIGLDGRHFRDALSASLEILGSDGLRPVDPAEALQDPESARWTLPALHRRVGADPTWAGTLDSLRAPRKAGQKEWEWRQEAPMRPVVFRDPRSLDGEVVHLHLEQRVVRRLLGRFLAQGFLHDELSRACVLRTDDPTPRVVAMGRLSLYGAGAARLHDEVISVAAEWVEPDLRGRARLKPLTEGARADVMRLLDEAMANPRLREVPESLAARLKTCAARDVAELIGPLERRGEDLAIQKRRLLADRGGKEAREMLDILQAQRERIARRRDEMDRKTAQGLLGLDFQKDEIRQMESDQRHWEARLRDLEGELEREPGRIRDLYEVKTSRIEPVGLVYLWPVSR